MTQKTILNDTHRSLGGIAELAKEALDRQGAARMVAPAAPAPRTGG